MTLALDLVAFVSSSVKQVTHTCHVLGGLQEVTCNRPPTRCPGIITLELVAVIFIVRSLWL